MREKLIPSREDYVEFYGITTRWMDNDVFGHVNNVVYYSYYDTVINRFIAEQGKVSLLNGDIAAFIVQSQCFYHSPVAYPEALTGAFKVNRVGNSSVEYGVAVFKENEQMAAAHGSMTHVFVDKQTGKPTAIPAPLKRVFNQTLK